MLDWSKAMQEFKTKELSPVYTCVGSEFVLVEQWLESLTRALAERSEFSVETVKKFSYDDGGLEEALFSCQSLSLFTSSQIVLVTDFWAATSAKGSTKAKFSTDILESYLDSPVPENVLVLAVNSDKLDERKKLVKRLKQYPVIDCTTPKEAQGKKTVGSILQSLGIQMTEDALSELWRRTPSISASVTESRKLSTYTDGKPITMQDVTVLVAPPAEDNIFDWIDGVVTGNADKSYRALADLVRAGQDTFSLLGMMVRQLRLMWSAKTLGAAGYTVQQVATEAGAHPYAVQVAGRQAQRLQASDIESLMTVIADAEFEVKSGRRDPELALDFVVAACLFKLRQQQRGSQRSPVAFSHR